MLHASGGGLPVHLAPFLQGLLTHSSTSSLQLPPVYPALHAHLYVLAAVGLAVLVESEHTAPLAHGELTHSFTSTSQLPVERGLLHCAWYCLMKAYSHTPLAYPGAHVHWYACAPIIDSAVESVHTAPFLHGLLAHSFESTAQ